ncbi:hypothetical protein QZH41_018777, partial [Actinostola sp. cb2023]
GKKVLQIDRNDYYGANCASLHLDQLYETFKLPDVPQQSKEVRDYNIDLIPKFLMAHGALVKLLVHTGVTKYMNFKQIEGSYVYYQGTFGGSIYKVPADDKEAIYSSIMGIFEKRRFRSFLIYVLNYDFDDPSTWQGSDPETTTMEEIFVKFGLCEYTAEFTGHAIALYLNDEHKTRPCGETIKRIKLYYDSLSRYGKSPYLYPVYGLGELPQSFARLSAVWGGTFMLNKPIDGISVEDGAVGVTSEGETAKAKAVIGDPSYFTDRHPPLPKQFCMIPYCYLIIIVSDIYVCCISTTNCVSPKDKYLAIVSTTVEKDDPEMDLKPGLDLLGKIDKKFISVSDIYEPISDGTEDKIFISKSYDATTHFETTCEDIMAMYKRITGEEFDPSSINVNLDVDM